MIKMLLAIIGLGGGFAAWNNGYNNHQTYGEWFPSDTTLQAYKRDHTSMLDLINGVLGDKDLTPEEQASKASIAFYGNPAIKRRHKLEVLKMMKYLELRASRDLAVATAKAKARREAIKRAEDLAMRNFKSTAQSMYLRTLHIVGGI